MPKRNYEQDFRPDIKYKFEWRDVGEEEILNEIEEIDCNKSSGLRDINSKTLKLGLKTLYKEFTHLIDLCIKRSIFPRAWKLGIVVPIPKKGDPRNIENLRPISLLPVTGKVLEMNLNNRIMEHLEFNNLLFERGGGGGLEKIIQQF